MTTDTTNTDAGRASALERDVRPCAWMHEDGRVVPAATMDAARRDGGAMLSSLRDYTVPLYADEPVRKLLTDAWVCGYYDAGYTHDSAYAYARADEHAAAALGPNFNSTTPPVR